MNITYFTKKEMSRDRLPRVFLEALEKIAPLVIIENGDSMSEEEQAHVYRSHPVFLMGRNSVRVPEAVAQEPGTLQYLCSKVGSVKPFITRQHLEAGILMTNWGNNGRGIAEGAVTLTLAALKDLHLQMMELHRDGLALDAKTTGGSLYKCNVGVYGCGAIGGRYIEMITPFAPRIHVYDPWVKAVPAGVHRVDSLDELFKNCRVIAIHAGLTDDTRGSVSKERLAMLPDNAVVVNTARGGIIDQDALFAELESGRLRAGLDVLEPDWLPPGHPAKQWENLIYTCHAIHRPWNDDPQTRTVMTDVEETVIENLRRFFAGEEPAQPITPTVYDRMT